jgi:hypothetical protein
MTWVLFPEVLYQAHIKQRQPILKGLHGKAAQDESDAEGPEPALGKVVGIVLNIGDHRLSDAADNAGHKPYTESERPDMVNMMNQSATDERRGSVAYRTRYSAPELATREAGTAFGYVIHSRAHAARIGDHLSGCDEHGECDCEPEAQGTVKSSGKARTANGGEHSFPGQRVVVQATRGAIELNRKSYASCDTGREAKEKTEAKTVSDSEDDRVGYRSGKQSQRPMLAAQQVIGKIQTSDHIKTGAGNADGGDGVVVHRRIIVEGMLDIWGGVPVCEKAWLSAVHA